MKKTWFELSVVVMIVIERDNHVLLGRRFNTGFKDGFYALPGGKHDGDECLRSSVAREAQEELGIEVPLDAIKLASCVHYIDRTLDQELLYTVFTITDYSGLIVNAEPHRCDDLQFFDVDNLPSNTTDMTRVCIRNAREQIPYAEFGWEVVV